VIQKIGTECKKWPRKWQTRRAGESEKSGGKIKNGNKLSAKKGSVD